MDFFTFLVAVKEHGHGAYVHAVHADAQDMGGKTGKLQGQHAQGLAAGGQFPAQQFFHRAGIGDVVGKGGQVVKAVGVGDELVVLDGLPDLFHAAVQVAHHRIAANDLFTIEFQHQPQHAVGGGVGGAHVQGHRFSERFGSIGEIVCVSGCICNGESFSARLHVDVRAWLNLIMVPNDYATSHHAGKPNVSFFGIPGELSVLMRKSPQLMNVRLF